MQHIGEHPFDDDANCAALGTGSLHRLVTKTLYEMQGSGPNADWPRTCGGKTGTVSDELPPSGVPSQMPFKTPSGMPSGVPFPVSQEAPSPTSPTPEEHLFAQAQPYLQHSLQAYDMQQPALEAKASREGERAKLHSQEGLTENASRGVDQCQVRAVHHPPPGALYWLKPKAAWVDHELLFNHAQQHSISFWKQLAM